MQIYAKPDLGDLGVETAVVIVRVFSQVSGIASNCWEWMVFRLQAGREQIAEMIKDSGGREEKFRWECGYCNSMHWIAGQRVLTCFDQQLLFLCHLTLTKGCVLHLGQLLLLCRMTRKCIGNDANGSDVSIEIRRAMRIALEALTFRRFGGIFTAICLEAISI